MKISIIIGIIIAIGVGFLAISQFNGNSDNIDQVEDNTSELQIAIDQCTNEISNMESSGNLERCLDDAYNQFGNEKEKQSWFDDEH